MGRKGDEHNAPSNRKKVKGRGSKKNLGGNGNRRQDRANARSRQDQFIMGDDDTMFCQDIGTVFDGGKINPLKGLRLRMWDFSQCDPKRCTGARLARRGIFQSMPLKQPFKGLVLSPNGSEPVSPTDVGILEEHGLSVIDCSWAR
jgi:pre-rRNA-processing protein TSR3